MGERLRTQRQKTAVLAPWTQSQASPMSSPEVASAQSPMQQNANQPSPQTHDFSRTPVIVPTVQTDGPGQRDDLPLEVRQEKLPVSQPGDPAERQADTMAQQIMRMPATTADQAQGGQVAAGPTIAATGSRGDTLAAGARDFFEPRFGHDFSGVRIHADEQAAASSRALNARAYTIGSEIYFDAGQYRPTTNEGQQLLAHELAHVVQQGGTASAVQREPNKVINVPTVTITGDPGPTTIPEVTIVGTQTATPTTITADPKDDIFKDTLASMNRVDDMARTKAIEYGQQLQFASEAFKNYSEPKYEEMKGQVVVNDLLAALMEKSLTMFSGQVLGEKVMEFGKEVGKAIFEKLSKAVTDKTKQAYTNENDAASIRASMGIMLQSYRDGTTHIQDGVRERLFPLTKQIREKCERRETLTQQEQDFTGLFVYEDTAVIDAHLGQVGIPHRAKPSELQLELYRGLVEAFEAKYILATASWGEKIGYGAAAIVGDEEHSLGKKAKEAANSAVSERQRALQPGQ